MSASKRQSVYIAVSLPIWLYRGLRWIKRRVFPSSITSTNNRMTLNLVGDRDIEWSWVASQMPPGPGEALDFGPGSSPLPLIAIERGFNVTAVDLEPIHLRYTHPRLHFIQGDILRLSLPKEHFDLEIDCSTVEHVGLIGRYGVAENHPNGDLEAMARLREMLKPGGVLLLTIPVGQDAVFAPWHRVYGKERLPRLLDGYVVEKEEFWVKDQENRWIPCDKETALNFEASATLYALGCFVLRPQKRREQKPF